ncbi:ABC transporter permease [Ruegeria marisrubri]|uniref:ABC transporter permease n=1 Tax=Ruegeria marisrubri TaxID=1685379 RepID=UPI001CD7277A|nr:ABC transporter permease [Ruegeria marisrubri]MCA0908154.1 ABC transporter permease [Ruegeria marisrubri]
MFYFKRNQTLLGGAFTTAELVFHATVRKVRSQHPNAIVAILINVLQLVVMGTTFYLLMSLMGRGGIPKIRGEFLLYVLSGVFPFMLHIQSIGAISGVGSANNPMMLHSPMNVMVTILSAALGILYKQLLAMFVILFIYSVAVAPIEVQDPGGAFAMLILAWFTGCAVGLVFMAMKPWFPTTVGMLTNIYRRLNMVFSGKMFVANTLGGGLLMMFAWNPLFHIIDQCRGFIFRNYFPRNTSWDYALWVGIALLMIGLMGEFFTRQHVSQSWNARR